MSNYLTRCRFPGEDGGSSYFWLELLFNRISGFAVALFKAMVALKLFAACGQLSVAEVPASRPVVGAIRWDAWHGPKSVGGRAVLKTLAPEKWRKRLPFFARVGPNGAFSLDGDSAEVMDREIAYAKEAGLDYWAFLAYGPDDPMSAGLRRFLASEHRNDVKFCIISETKQWQPENAAAQAARFAYLMKLPNYETVGPRQPLFFFLNQETEATEEAWSKNGGFGSAVTALRAAARECGVAEPCIVAMVPWPEKAKAFAEACGCDAISAYAVQNGGQAAPYAELAKFTEDFWSRCSETGAQVVPLAMSGWDRRPRVETPVPWENNQGWDAEPGRFYLEPQPAELAAHVRRAITWISDHPQSAGPRAVIIYSWNEYDEGGWLCPTLGDDDGRVKALGAELSKP